MAASLPMDLRALAYPESGEIRLRCLRDPNKVP
jgi:hypothetical protein